MREDRMTEREGQFEIRKEEEREGKRNAPIIPHVFPLGPPPLLLLESATALAEELNIVDSLPSELVRIEVMVTITCEAEEDEEAWLDDEEEAGAEETEEGVEESEEGVAEGTGRKDAGEKKSERQGTENPAELSLSSRSTKPYASPFPPFPKREENTGPLPLVNAGTSSFSPSRNNGALFQRAKGKRKARTCSTTGTTRRRARRAALRRTGTRTRTRRSASVRCGSRTACRAARCAARRGAAASTTVVVVTAEDSTEELALLKSGGVEGARLFDEVSVDGVRLREGEEEEGGCYGNREDWSSVHLACTGEEEVGERRGDEAKGALRRQRD
jgi:hypothetical protein